MTEVKDQDCAVCAPSAKFFVTALGEVLIDGELCQEVSSIDCRELADRTGFDWNLVCLYREPAESTDAERWFATIKKEWKRLYSACLTEKQHRFLRKVLNFQQAAQDGRFRLCGEITQGRREKIVLCTEFIGLIEKADFWTEVNATAKKLGARVWVMSVDNHLDHVIYDYDKPTRREVYGPDHGKLERQVEFSWQVGHMTTHRLKSFVEQMKQATESIWKQGGVSVS